jgi:hypothetical protein
VHASLDASLARIAAKRLAELIPTDAPAEPTKPTREASTAVIPPAVIPVGSATDLPATGDDTTSLARVPQVPTVTASDTVSESSTLLLGALAVHAANRIARASSAPTSHRHGAKLVT